MELPSRIAGIMLASAWAIMRKMFSLIGILSKEARISPVVVSGSVRGNLATRFSLGFHFCCLDQPLLRQPQAPAPPRACCRVTSGTALYQRADGSGTKICRLDPDPVGMQRPVAQRLLL